MIQPLLDPAFTIVVGDRLPDVVVTVRDKDGNPRALTGFTADFYAIKHDATVPKINYVAMALTDLPNGILSYTWGATDTDTPGVFFWRVRLTRNTDGKLQHTLWRCYEVEDPSQHPLRSK